MAGTNEFNFGIIKHFLLGEDSDDNLPNDLTSEEEDIVEDDDVKYADDTDSDPTWDESDEDDDHDFDDEPSRKKRKRSLDSHNIIQDKGESDGSKIIPENVDKVERLYDIETPQVNQNDPSSSSSQPDSSHVDDVTAAPSSVSNPEPFSLFKGQKNVCGKTVNYRRSWTKPFIQSSTNRLAANQPSIHESIFQSSHRNPCILQLNQNIVQGKDKRSWTTKYVEPATGIGPNRNIIPLRPEPQNNAKNATTPRDCYELFFDAQIMGIVIQYTNDQIQRVRAKYKEQKSTTAPVTADELNAFVGLLIFTATMKNNHLSVREMFNTELCGPRYRAVMSSDRFEFILHNLRFDDKATRSERSQSDPLAPIRRLWDIFVKNCELNYKPSSYVTIGEQLLAFRGKCRFSMCNPNKPEKYGLKLVMLCDVSTSYMYNATPYLGKKTDTGGLPVTEYFLKELTKPIHGSNRNVTGDNCFSSVKVMDDLLSPPISLTYVGEIRSSKRELPKEVKNIKSRPVGTSIFIFDHNKTLVSYKPKSNKVMLVLSTMHSGPELNHTTNKPKIIHSYNETKGAVDMLDQMCRNFSSSRKTSRWPLCLFYGIQNIIYVNSFIIHSMNRTLKQEKRMSRKAFNLELSNQLIFPHLRNRLLNPSLQRSLRIMISSCLGVPMNSENPPAPPGGRKVCFFCPASKRRMTTSFCNHCRQPMCGEHKAFCCVQCDEEK